MIKNQKGSATDTVIATLFVIGLLYLAGYWLHDKLYGYEPPPRKQKRVEVQIHDDTAQVTAIGKMAESNKAAIDMAKAGQMEAFGLLKDRQLHDMNTQYMWGLIAVFSVVGVVFSVFGYFFWKSQRRKDEIIEELSNKLIEIGYKKKQSDLMISENMGRNQPVPYGA